MSMSPFSTDLDTAPAASKTIKTAAASFKPNPHKILYPAKSQCSTAATAWVGATPLDMIRSVVALAEKSPDFYAEFRRLGVPSLCKLLTERKTRAGDKRKAKHIDHYDNEMSLRRDDEDDEVVEALITSCTDLKPRSSNQDAWKPYDTLGATEEVTCLEGLANELERLIDSDPKNAWCLPSYSRVRQAISILGAEDSTDDAIKRATSQMRRLVELVQSSATEPTTAKRTNSEFFNAPTLPSPSENIARRKVFNKTMTVWLKHNWTNPFPDEGMVSKLAYYMLTDFHCIEISRNEMEDLKGKSLDEQQRIMFVHATEKIKVWLMNARTRIWRPTLIEAFNQKRPSSLLLEDSLRVMDKKKLRPLSGWDGHALFSFHPLFSTPLSMWKKHDMKEASKASVKAGKRKGGMTPKRSEAVASKAKDEVSPSNIPLPFDTSPICGQLDKLLTAAGIAASDSSHMDDISPDVTEVSFSDASKRSKAVAMKAKDGISPLPEMCLPKSPPPFDISPICGQIDKLLTAADMITSETSHVDDMSLELPHVSFSESQPGEEDTQTCMYAEL